MMMMTTPLMFIINYVNIIYHRDASNTPYIVDKKDTSHTPTFSSKVQGLLRTKMEGGKNLFSYCVCQFNFCDS